MRGCSELTDAPDRPPCPPLRAAPDSSQVHAPGWAVRGDGARSGIWPGAELHGWPQNRNASPQAEPNPQFVSMDEDMAVWRRRLRLCAMIGTVLASWPKDDLHGWRQNRESTPWVERGPDFIAKGGDMALSDDLLRLCAMLAPHLGANTPGQARCSVTHLHGWRQNRGSSPWVEPKSEFPAMGGDLAGHEGRASRTTLGGPRVPHCTMADDLEASALKEAFDVARESAVFGPARLVSVGVVSFRPVRQLSEYPLAGGAPAAHPD